jgi:hypothetical protein
MSIQSKFPRTGLLAVLSASFVFSGIFPAFSHADLSEDAYQAALKAADKKVQRQKSLNSQSANALSSSLIRNLFGRYYQVGDNWDVAAWSFDNTMARMTTDPAHLESKGGRGGVFHYQVIEVKNAPKPEVVIQVTQREEFGLHKQDARVQALKLSMNDTMLQSQKTYVMTDRSGATRSIKVSPDGIHSAITGLELFPLDVPELLTAESTQASSVPELPEGLRGIASQAGYHPAPGKCLWFEQDDFFGRPIQAMWQSGDPWPAYLKTSSGVSILIRKGAS